MSASRCAVRLVGDASADGRDGWDTGAAGECRRLSFAIRAAARMALAGARVRQVITQPA